MGDTAMNKSSKIVVIGGTACGPKSAARARRCDPNVEITIIEQGENISSAICGFPYYVSNVINKRENLLIRGPDYFKNVMNIDALIQTKAETIDHCSHTVEITNLRTQQVSKLEYDKLIIATGSTPIVLDIEGKQLNGIFTLSRIEHADLIKSYVAEHKVKRAVIIGAGFIGLEMAEALDMLGIDITIIEALDWVMTAFLDPEMAAHLEKHMRSKGVAVLYGQRVIGFQGNQQGAVSKVITNSAEIETQLVLIAVGTRPNIALARDAGLKIGLKGGITVNEHLQTSNPDIYAGGDCVENVNQITGEMILVPLGSTANKHGRVIGTNVTGGSDIFPGVMGTAIAKVFDLTVGRVGCTEKEARNSGYPIVTSLTLGNEHATYYPGNKQFLVKFIVDSATNRVLGSQMVGSGDLAKRIDVLATALSFKATIHDLANLDLAYAPPYNSAIDPIHHAANTIRNKQDGLANGITAEQVKAKIDKDEDFILLDVRSLAEWREKHIAASQSKLIPLDELRQKLKYLPQDKEIIILCHSSMRAYQGQRILQGAGFKNVKFMDGSMVAWPYQTSFTK
jgi:NADPH-dependent 2,4-dienoyl-CoA reductase/sulfur reductase-like enzyme/rhodanese-related sulfurtransferase